MENDFSTTFLSDFRIAEQFGIDAVKDTFNRAFNEWKSHYQYITDLCIVVNHLCWYHYEALQNSELRDKHNHQELSQLYADYYYQVRDWCLDNLKGKEFEYFFKMTD